MIPKTHPRYKSLLLRDKVKNAFKEGYLADSGMIAHGRGETFDYLIGEKTTETGRLFGRFRHDCPWKRGNFRLSNWRENH